jgi:class 3 adenylate cyclase
MAQSPLKALLRKQSSFKAWLEKYAALHASSIAIADAGGELLFGSEKNDSAIPVSIILQGDEIGTVLGDEHGEIVAQLITQLLEKEAEKKKLGNEVLHLYQELNFIYNFSEKLTETIDPDTIAKIALEQAMHSIPSHSGAVVLWDDIRKVLNVPAVAGEELFNANNLSLNRHLLLQIGMNGQSEIIEDLASLKENGIIADDTQTLVYAAMKVKHRIMGAIILAGKDKEQFSAGHLKLLVTLSLQASSAIENALLYERNIREVREREEAILRIHEVTKKFVPNEFIRSLGKETLTDVILGDQVEKIVTVLFTDIRDFTTLSENMTPEENFRFVSSFNARLGPIIRSHRGFINQYLGDSIMAIFPEEPEDALLAGIHMQQEVTRLNEERHQAGLPPIRAGIGMHTGPLIMGITGDEYRLDAATISDTVNTAARIESLSKHYHSDLLLSNETLRLIPNAGKYLIRNLGKVQLKGKLKLLSISECFDGRSETEQEIKKQTLPVFQEASHQFAHGDFGKAIDLFGQVISMDAHDYAAILFLNHCSQLLSKGDTDQWTGVLEMQVK